jgi:Transposase IS116/IS110/IS902 family
VSSPPKGSATSRNSSRERPPPTFLQWSRPTLGVLLAQLRSLDAAIDELERVADHRRDPVSRLAASVPGVGVLAASAILASAPDPQALKSCRDFAAWLGATPKQNYVESHEDFDILSHGPPSVHEARLGMPEQPSFLPARKGGPPAPAREQDV